MTFYHPQGYGRSLLERRGNSITVDNGLETVEYSAVSLKWAVALMECPAHAMASPGVRDRTFFPADLGLV
jgi:hypothetical protein